MPMKKFFDYAYVSPEIFFYLPPPQKFVLLCQNPRKCWSKHDDTPPPPPMLMASRRPCLDGYAVD